jgi:hypothetical protein
MTYRTILVELNGCGWRSFMLTSLSRSTRGIGWERSGAEPLTPRCAGGWSQHSLIVTQLMRVTLQLCGRLIAC